MAGIDTVDGIGVGTLYAKNSIMNNLINNGVLRKKSKIGFFCLSLVTAVLRVYS